MMFQSRPRRILLRGIVLLVAVATADAALAADRIYLKNGRVIRTPSARVVDDRVEFIQFGQKASIPMSVVLRIEEDDTPPEPEAGPAPPPAPVPPRDEADDVEPAGEPDAEDEAEEAVPPEQTPEYWSGRIRAIQQEKADIVEEIKRLRREERAFLFSHRSTAETRRNIEAAQARDKELDQEMVDLRREARRLGVPPGWLRVRPATGS